MRYILEGDPKEVAKVLQENRIRVDRGVIKFTPCPPDVTPEPEEAESIDDKTPEPEEAESIDDKTPEHEDMTEVNLDDIKDAEESDTKDAPVPTPKKSRSKKSE